jgi:hypothetical protein
MDTTNKRPLESEEAVVNKVSRTNEGAITNEFIDQVLDEMPPPDDINEEDLMLSLGKKNQFQVATMMPAQGQPYLDFYYMSCHGSNINTNNNFYPIDTKVSGVILYSSPYESYADRFEEMFKKNNSKYVCRFIYGSCPRIPVYDKLTGESKVYLPPLVFSADDKEPEFMESMGLYHFRMTLERYEMTSYVKPICKVIESTKVISNNDLILKYKQVGFTYSDIMNMVETDCRKKNINPRSVLLAISSCQAYGRTLDDIAIQTDVTKTIPRHVTSGKIYYSIDEVPYNESFATALTLHDFDPINYHPQYLEDEATKVLRNTSFLAKDKKCASLIAFVVASGFMTSENAESQALCSITQGNFNIFNLIKYVYPQEVDNDFIVCRMPSKYALNYLLRDINNFDESYFVVIGGKVPPGKNEPDFIYLLGRDQDKIYFIIYYTQFNMFYTDKVLEFELGFEYIDEITDTLLFIADPDIIGPDPNSYLDVVFNVGIPFVYDKAQMNTIIKDNKGVIITPDTYKTALAPKTGGQRRKRTTRKIRHSKTKRTNKRKNRFSKKGPKYPKYPKCPSSSRKRKHSHYAHKIFNKNRIGSMWQQAGASQLDPFEQLMMDMDKKNNTQSRLIME